MKNANSDQRNILWAFLWIGNEEGFVFSFGFASDKWHDLLSNNDLNVTKIILENRFNCYAFGLEFCVCVSASKWGASVEIRLKEIQRLPKLPPKFFSSGFKSAKWFNPIEYVTSPFSYFALCAMIVTIVSLNSSKRTLSSSSLYALLCLSYIATNATVIEPMCHKNASKKFEYLEEWPKLMRIGASMEIVQFRARFS